MESSPAKHRLADEYDAAQERGEVARNGGDRGNQHTGGRVPDGNSATAADLGLTRPQIHDARQIRDAEKTEPGIVKRTLQACLAEGEEPSKALTKNPQPIARLGVSLAL